MSLMQTTAGFAPKLRKANFLKLLIETTLRNRTRRTLAELPDRVLTDIGISRSEVHWIAVHIVRDEGRRR